MGNRLKPVWPVGAQDRVHTHYAFLLRAEHLKESAVLRLAAENLYRVHIGGRCAGAGPVRCAHGVSQIDEFPLSPYLSGGFAVVCVEVTGYGISVLSDVNDPPFFAAEIVAGETVCYSSSDFVAYPLSDVLRRVPRYSWQRYFLECYRMERDRAGLWNGDADGLRSVPCEVVAGNRLVPRDVSYPRYETQTVSGPIAVGTVGEQTDPAPYPERYLYEIGENGFPYETIPDSPIEEYLRMKFTVGGERTTGGRFALYDLGRDLSGFLLLRIRVTAPARVFLLWDEVLSDAGTVDPLRMRMANMIRYDLAVGDYLLESMEPYTLRYAEAVLASGEATVAAVGVRRYENPDAARLTVEGENRALSVLTEAARATLAQNAVDILTDCPSRERVGWLCDSFFTGAAEALFTGENRVERHFLETYLQCGQSPYLPQGMLPKSYPGEFPLTKNFIPNWAMWYVLELCAYRNRTGDTEIALQARGQVEALLRYFARFENEIGLLEDLESWVFVEWSRANDFVDGVNFPSNMLYSGMLDAAAELYGLPRLAEKAATIRNTVRELSRGKDGFYRDHAVREKGELKTAPERSETCQYYALAFGVADRERDAVLVEILLRDFGPHRDADAVYPDVYPSNAFIGNLLRLIWLSDHGYAEDVFAQISGYYLGMAQKTGTLWEYDSPQKSCCHGFAACIAVLLLRAQIGYVGRSGNRLRFLPTFLQTDCRVVLPLPSGKSATVTVQNGKRTICIPEGYRIEESNEGFFGRKERM